MMRALLLCALVAAAAPVEAAITFFGVASTPVDNGANAAEPTVVTPPASMILGDLAYVSCSAISSAIEWTVTETGGQTWTALAHNNHTTSGDVLYTTFDGTWDADPSFEPSGTGADSTCVMLVFRPTVTVATWSVNVALAYETETAGTTFTVAGQTRTASSCVSIATFASEASTGSTWGSLSGTGWSQSGLGAQYRNTESTDLSAAFAYNIGTGASNDVSLTQNQSVAGYSAMMSFCELVPGRIHSLTLLGVTG